MVLLSTPSRDKNDFKKALGASGDEIVQHSLVYNGFIPSYRRLCQTVRTGHDSEVKLGGRQWLLRIQHPLHNWQEVGIRLVSSKDIVE
jgi:hypothetical protein